MEVANLAFAAKGRDDAGNISKEDRLIGAKENAWAAGSIAAKRQHKRLIIMTNGQLYVKTLSARRLVKNTSVVKNLALRLGLINDLKL
jgi:hypothetical protein